MLATELRPRYTAESPLAELEEYRRGDRADDQRAAVERRGHQHPVDDRDHAALQEQRDADLQQRGQPQQGLDAARRTG